MRNVPTAATSKPTRAKDFTAQIQEQIRRRAHELYEQRGRQNGYDLQDWLWAEAELTEVAGLKSKGASV